MTSYSLAYQSPGLVACYFDHHYCGTFCYADDIVLLAPSPAALRHLLASFPHSFILFLMLQKHNSSVFTDSPFLTFESAHFTFYGCAIYLDSLHAAIDLILLRWRSTIYFVRSGGFLTAVILEFCIRLRGSPVLPTGSSIQQLLCHVKPAPLKIL